MLSIAIAIALGTLGAFLARSLVQNPGYFSGQPAGRHAIVVAAEPIGFGVALRSENLREVPWPADDVLEGAFTSIPDLVKDGPRLTLANLKRNEPVLASKVTGPNQRASLSTQIEAGMRAVSIRVDEVRGVAGFVLPGDRVDVVLARGETGAQDGAAAYADLLLQNAKVLAIDQFANERQDKPTVARAVTLELDVQQAQRVILAQGIGRLSLVLRQAGEVENNLARRVNASELGSGEMAASSDRFAALEKRFEEYRKSSEQSNARAGEGALQRVTELESRLRDELTRSRNSKSTVAPQSAVPAVEADPVVNVIRNGTKRDQYSVISER